MGLFTPNLEKLVKKKDIDGLLKALRYKKAHYIRMKAAEALGKLRDKKAVDQLIHALEDEDEFVRREAAEALGKIRNKKAVDPLIHMLMDKDEYVRTYAAEALGKIRDKKAVDPLIHVIKDEDMGEAATVALIRLGEPAVKPLIQMLKDKNEDVRERAVWALEKLGWEPKRDIGKARYLIVKGEWDELVQLGQLAVGPLIHALEDEDARANAAEALGKIGDEKAVDPLIHTLEDEERMVRRNAAGALGRIGDKKAVGPLIQMLKDKNEDVRNNAAEALSRIGDPSATECVIDYLFSFSFPIDIMKSMENLLGDYSSLIVKAAYVEVLRGYTDSGSTTEIDDSTNYSYKLDTALKATKELCRIPTKITGNILWVISNREDREVLKERVGGWARDWNEFEILSFESQRKIVKKELSQRGNPPYEPSAYLDKKAWKL